MSNSHKSLGKRFLSTLLVLVMVIGMLPTIAFAAEPVKETLITGKVSVDLSYDPTGVTDLLEVGSTRSLDISYKMYTTGYIDVLSGRDQTTTFTVTNAANPGGIAPAGTPIVRENVTDTGEVVNTSVAVTLVPGENVIYAHHLNRGIIDDKTDEHTFTITIPASGIKVTYNNPNGSAVTDANEYTTGDSITLLTPAAREGFEFVGWKDAGGTVYPANSTITAEYSHIDLTAVWKHPFTITDGSTGVDETLYEGTFNLAVKSETGGAVIPAEVKTAAAALAAEKSQLAYFTADVLYNSVPVTGAVLSDNYPVAVSDLALPEGAAAKVYHWNGSDLEEVTDVTVGASGTINFETNKFSPFVVLVNPVTVTFVDKNGYIVDEKVVESGSKVNLISAPAADAGYTFNGWKNTADSSVIPMGITFINPLTDTTLQATYKVGGSAGTTYTVTFKAGVSGVYDLPSNTTYTGTYNITTDQPGRDGYTFAAWYDGTNYYKYDSVSGKWQSSTTLDGTYADFTGFSDKNVTLTAQWTKNTTYSVTYSSGVTGVVTGMPDSVTGIAAGSDFVISQSIPARAGYTFKGWDSDGDGTADKDPGATITVSANVTLKAVWEQNTVQVTLSANGTGYTIAASGLTVGGTASVNEGSTQTFTVKLTEGYDPSTLVVTANGVALAPVLTDVANRVYTYSFVANVDTQILVSTPKLLKYTITLPYGDSFTAVFTGCKRGGADLTAANNTTAYTFEYGDTFQVKVAPKPGYKLSMTVNGAPAQSNGAASMPITNVTGEKTTQSYTVDKDYNIAITVDAIKFYTVTYVVDGAQLTTREVEEGTLVKTLGVNIPSKDGYTASAWYTDSTYGTLVSAASTATVTGDMEVYAKYVPTTATITFDQNGGTGGPTSQIKVYGVPLNLSGLVPTKAGCTFMGWDTDSQAKVAVYQPGDLYSTEGAATLYAVWKTNTYTVTLPTGTGYTISTSQSTIVEHGKDFVFTVKVDRDYSTTAPVVSWTKADGTGGATLTNPNTDPNYKENADGSKSYTYTITNFTEDRVVSVTVKENLTYTVTFYTWKNDGTTTEVYQTQQVEDTYKATQPAAPVIEGYTFNGWYTVKGGDKFTLSTGTADKALDAAYNFDTPVTDNLVVVAEMVAIKPVVTIPANGTGWEIDFTDATGVPGTGTDRTHTHAYNDDCTFKVTIAEGYDASNMQVGANGVALAPIDITGNVYTYKLTGVKVNTAITVVGVVRKTVTITYNANARDDVSGMPEQQVVKYYLASDYDTITTQTPTRTGYNFLGWSTNSEATAADAGYDVNTIKSAAGATAAFTKDTTLYAIWEAKDVRVELTFSDILGATGEWEKDDVLTETFNLVATFNQPVIGDVTFKKTTIGGEEVTLGTVAINGGKSVTLKDVEAGSFLNVNPPEEEYWVEFKANVDEGYSDATSAKVDLRINSRALAWKFVANGNKLTIKNSNGTTVDSMTAGQTYTLELPDVVALNAVQYAGDIVAGTQYRVKWQYRETAKSGWVTAQEDGGDTYLVTSEFSGYAFRALVEPMDAPFTKAATYVDNRVTAASACLINDKYALYLETLPTADTVRQETETALEILGATDEGSDVVINGDDTVFSGIGAHKAQFEGDKVTLKATVVDKSTGEGVPSVGFVNFYLNGVAEPLNDAPVAVGANGVATFEWTTSAYTGSNPTTALDSYTAEYLVNETYEDSVSAAALVYIKSTTIQTPVIDEIDDSSNVIGSTTYTTDLDNLLAGVKHTFKLRTGNAAADWSVVAKDGRTVASTDYTIQWLVTTGTNEEKAANNETAATFVVNESKSGDKYRVKLVPTADGDMKTGATSNYVVIDSLQNVTVKVTASDEIKSTTGVTDVYQLNNITLTAEVQGKDSQIMLPTGNVSFYYSVDNTNWVEIGTAALKLDDVSRTMKATFETDKLPVDVVNGYKQEEVTITAVYAGDETFQKSGEFNTTTKEITDTVAGAVTDETVTVYSSVVLVHAAEENKAVTTLADSGIHISANGSLVANETDVALTLQQVYTLDYDIDLSKLVYGTDYTVEWQILENASLYNQSGYYGNTEKWNDIGATGRSYTIGTVPQDAAYRAEITVVDTAAAVQGSAQGVLQATAGDFTTGRRVYYSNVLVVGAGQATVTTNITTSDNTNFNEEGIVEGETVTIHALVAGASNVTPISNLTATITAKNVAGLTPGYEVFSDEVTTVNGYNAFIWNTTGVTPGYYTLTVKATSNNGYAPQTITRTLIVRDKTYTLTATNESKVYNGKAQGIDWTLTGVDIENPLAQNSVVVYYYQNGKMVEPTQAGIYDYELYLPASAYWTELTHVTGTFTIEKRTVNVVDLVAQAKVYDGTTDINELEVILNDSTVDGNGVATGNNGIINGDSLYATGVMSIDEAEAGEQTLSVSNVTLHGDDANNYTVGSTNYTETINVQRSQVKGDIANSTFKYTGSNITVPADDIILIDQAGNVITSANYTVTYYYHNGDGVEKVTAMNKLGKYTVIARPEQTNYKGGASQVVYVAATANDQAPVTTAKSALIDITNTVELFGAADNRGIVATATNGATTSTIYYVNGAEQPAAPTAAGRYLVKVTTDTNDTAYGIYTIVKARPKFVPTTDAAEVTYNSAPYSGTVNAGFVTGKSDSTAETYITYTGGTIQGIAYEAPTEVGKYIATVHVGETDNYTAHEEQVAFEIKPKALTITADELQRWQYGSYPDMVATFEGLATGGVAADTSLRDVQIQPEFIFNDLNGDGQPEYTNSALDQVGKDYPITVRNALARNYTVTYVAGSYAVNELDPKADLAIHGMIDNGTTTENIAYYGDQIQLYAYGNYKSNGDGTGVYNPSSLLKWSLSAGAPATIDQDGLLTITGVGDFTVTLTRGSGDAAISTSIEITALKQEVKVIIPEENKVYSAAPQSYTKPNISAVNGKLETITDPVTSKVAFTNDSRTNVGSQIVNAVVSGAAKYQSETYGGLFTINDKEVTVAPVVASVVYGETLGALTYSETGTVGGVNALTNGKAVSIRDAYANLDVLDGYEILVAGVENKNYNVKYITDQTAPDAQVTAKPLTFQTGVINSDGRTSGYMENDSLFFEDAGYAITGISFNTTPNDRMYGEVNPVMDYLFDALIAGDSEADLADLLAWLVKYSDGAKHNINGNANVKFDKNKHLSGHRATTAAEFISGAVNNYVIDGMLGTAGVKNYTTTVTEATQNIYQRPVTLSVRPGVTLTAYKPSIIDDSNNVKQDVLLQLLLNNLVVGEYSTGKGGLATLLGHTIEDLDIQIVTAIYNGTDTIDVTITLGNTNYWTEDVNFTVKVDPTKIVATYGPLGWTRATVTMIGVDKSGNTTGPVDVTGTVTYLIYVKDTNLPQKYSSYKDLTPVRSVTMTRGGSTGYYIANYDRLSAGDYVMFAIAEGYTIIE